MRQSDILDTLKRKHPHLTEETIKLILRSFHDGFRYYLSRPEESKSGILINNLMCAYVPAKKIEKFINDVKYKGAMIRQDANSKKIKQTKEEILEYYENLLQIVKQHERQNGKKRHDDGSIRRVSIKLTEAEADQSEQ